MKEIYDFSGWATKNDLKCSDGRTIRRDAFLENDGEIVPLIFSHSHDNMNNIVGHALLENRPQGVYTYGKFNNTDSGRVAKELVNSGDITHLSIYANNLRENAGEVFHGKIREVSLVLAGANPGAVIDCPVIEHADGSFEEAMIYTYERIDANPIEFSLEHEDTSDDKTVQDALDSMDSDQKAAMYYVISQIAGDLEDDEDDEEEGEDEMAHSDERTVQDVLDSMSEEQKDVMYDIIGQIIDDMETEDDTEGDEMKHNVFDNETATGAYLSHDDMKAIFSDAKRLGSLKEAVTQYEESGMLMHSIDTEGMIGPSDATSKQAYGFRDPDMLFPEYRSFTTQPEWIKRDTTWVDKVINGAHHSPFSRIKSVFADITEDEARARGYIKGKQKKEEVFTLLKRTTDPQTVYKKQKLDRDDVIDITDFDVVAWIRGEMRIMLDEEIARASLIGDGRLNSSDDKISEDHIRPIFNDVPLFTIKTPVTGTTDAELAKNFINESIRSRKNYKGTGTPTLFTTADVHTEMLLLEDQIGHKLYKSDSELATALRVKEIVEVEPLEGTKLDGKTVLGVIVNMADYNIGADKGGSINMFDDFDIDYNQMKYLIETRVSGALTKPFSAITLYRATDSGESE